MGLLPLEFTDALQDSPYFRDSLHSHEKELERTSHNIKELIKEVKNLINTAKSLSKAQRSLAAHLISFRFDCIGSNQTDDELVIAGSLKEFGRLINTIEDERDRMLERAYDNFIVPLETFRKEQVGSVKERKKKFDKQTAKFCASQERYLGLSTKKQDNVLQEADATLEMEQRDFARAALEYVCLIQEVQERKKFEFVETIQAFMYGWLTFYHQGHEASKDCKPYMTDLQIRVQNTRENFKSSRDDIQALMRKMLEVRQTKPLDPGTLNKMYTRTGYLFLAEKKALGTTWQKCYCQYIRENRTFCMIPYNQTTSKITNTESFRLKSCIRRPADSIDKRFCFDIIPDDRPTVTYTLQAQSEDDRQLWLEALDGTEPPYAAVPGGKLSNANQTFLDESGFNFMQSCLAALESRGLEDQGMYRVVGVASKVTKLMTVGLDRKRCDQLQLEDNIEWETKTVTSAIKTFLRNLPEPLMTFSLYSQFIEAGKCENYTVRLGKVHRLIQQLPGPNARMLEMLLSHLSNVVVKCDKNLMTVANLGVCFGPTLLRPEEETVAAIMDIKFANVVVEILIQNWQSLLKTKPDSNPPPKPSHSKTVSPVKTSPTVKPPPYIPPPPPSVSSPPTLVQTVIFDGPKMQAAIQSSPGSQPGNNGPNGPSYATWERTLRGQGGAVLSSPGLGPSAGPPGQVAGAGVRSMSSVSSSLSNLSSVSTVSNTPTGVPWPRPSQRNIHSLQSGSRHQSASHLRDTRETRESHAARDSGLLSGYDTSTTGTARSSRGSSTSSTDSLTSWSSNTHSQHSHHEKHQDTGQVRHSLAGPGTGVSGMQAVELRRVRTLYACVGEHETELSFEPNQIISNVRPSLEPGWLEGILDGRVGLVPENYVEFLT